MGLFSRGDRAGGDAREEPVAPSGPLRDLDRCPLGVHDSAAVVVPAQGNWPERVDLAPTVANLQERVRDGRMRVTGGDVALDDLERELAAEQRLSLTVLLTCACGQVLRLAVSPRSASVGYRTVRD